VLARPDYGGGSWMCREHTRETQKTGAPLVPLPVLDGAVVRHIYEYAVWRPRPTFTFEPGDLLLEARQNNHETAYIVARKRVPK